MRMIQAGDGFRFLFEALPQSWIARKVRGKNLDRDGAVQTRIAGPVDLTHATRAKRRDDFIRPETGASGE